MGRQGGHDAARDVEHHVVSRAGEPHDNVVLRRGERVTVWAHDGLGESGEPGRGGLGCDQRPELGSKAGYEVDATDRRARLPEGRDKPDKLARIRIRAGVELKIGVGHRAEREDPGLGRRHLGSIPVGSARKPGRASGN